MPKEENYQLLIGWQNMDTSFAATLSDTQLLNMIEHIFISNGWGLVAELMKRYTAILERKPNAIDL